MERRVNPNIPCHSLNSTSTNTPRSSHINMRRRRSTRQSLRNYNWRELSTWLLRRRQSSMKWQSSSCRRKRKNKIYRKKRKNQPKWKCIKPKSKRNRCRIDWMSRRICRRTRSSSWIKHWSRKRNNSRTTKPTSKNKNKLSNNVRRSLLREGMRYSRWRQSKIRESSRRVNRCLKILRISSVNQIKFTRQRWPKESRKPGKRI